MFFVGAMEALIDGILSYSSIDNTEESEYEINTYELVDDIVKLIPIPKSIDVKIATNLPVMPNIKFGVSILKINTKHYI